jgi:pterin-4a-carbinolamine dehydratase
MRHLFSNKLRSTHDAGGISANDFRLAAAMNARFA